RARRLLAADSSLERAYGEIMRGRPAPEAMVDALVFSLRRGVGELTNPDAQRRLSALDAGQLEGVCLRVPAFQPKISPRWVGRGRGPAHSTGKKFREQRGGAGAIARRDPRQHRA